MKSRELEGVFRIGPIRYVNSAARSQRHALSSKFNHVIQLQFDLYCAHILLVIIISSNENIPFIIVISIQLCIASTGKWREAGSITNLLINLLQVLRTHLLRNAGLIMAQLWKPEVAARW